MKIGILGTRGIPNAYGGFEQFAQFLAEGLVMKGHEVYVYNSSKHPYQQKTWNKIHIIHCRDIESSIGTAGQFVYDLNCIRDARKRNYDILLQLGYTSNSIWYKLWPKQSINVINMDGLEWKRNKYSKRVQKFLKRAELLAAKNGDILIADSLGIKEYLFNKYQKQSTYIPYGAQIFSHPDETVLSEWQKLEANKYLLIIARMEPENNIETIIQGYLNSSKIYPLVIIGNTNNNFGQYLVSKYKDPSLLFLGSVFDLTKTNNLRHFSALYFHGHSVGGTNPSLIEAMACSCKIVAHNNIFNKAILENEALYFTNADQISDIINQLPDQKERLEKMASVNLQKITTTYNWPKIIADYEDVFVKALSERG